MITIAAPVQADYLPPNRRIRIVYDPTIVVRVLEVPVLLRSRRLAILAELYGHSHPVTLDVLESSLPPVVHPGLVVQLSLLRKRGLIHSFTEGVPGRSGRGQSYYFAGIGILSVADRQSDRDLSDGLRDQNVAASSWLQRELSFHNGHVSSRGKLCYGQ